MVKSRSVKSIEIKESPLFWPAEIRGDTLYVLDETLIPSAVKYTKVKNTRDAVKCIREMKTRAFGQFLVVLSTFLLELKSDKNKNPAELAKKLEAVANALNQSRPTFPFAEVTGFVVGVAYGALKEGKDVRAAVERSVQGYLAGIRQRRLERVRQIAGIIQDHDSILTHCNVSGELAMAAYICLQQKKKIQFFATETRPYFQGAKLTCWELNKMGAEVTLIADNAVASVMADGLVNKVIVGSDRNCANGDFANKIGTYQIAVLAKEFGLPFYVLTQPSSRIKSGKDIPIEIRPDKELLMFEGKRYAPSRVKGFYPGFDVIPNKYITEAIAINVGSTR